MQKFTYNTNDKLPIFPLLLYGLQWLLVTLPSILIIGAVVAQFHYDTLADQLFYTQRLFGVVGAALLVQILWGHRLPIVIGPASVLLIGILSSQGDKVSEIYTAIFIGGLLIFLLSFVKPVLKQIPCIFSSRIVIVILALIAFTLMPTIIRLLFAGKLTPLGGFFLGLGGFFALVLSHKLLKGMWKATVVLWGLLLGSFVYYYILEIPLPLANREGELTASFFSFPLKIDVGILISFLFCYVALFINELGSIQGVAKAIGENQTHKATRKGVRFTGIANAVAGLLGVIGTVDFSFSPGIIMATACASRYALLPAGVALLLIAFFPGLLTIFLQIPPPVMGFVFLYLMTSQLAASLQMIPTTKSVTTFEEGLTLSIPILIAVLVAFLPDSVQEAIPALLRPILSNAFVMGVLAVLVLEHLVFGKKSFLRKMI